MNRIPVCICSRIKLTLQSVHSFSEIFKNRNIKLISTKKKKRFVHTNTYIVCIPLLCCRLQDMMTIVLYMGEEKRQFDPLHVQAKNCKRKYRLLTAFVMVISFVRLFKIAYTR